MAETTEPVTFAEADDVLSPYEALEHLMGHAGAMVMARPGDVVPHLEHISLISAVVHRWSRFRPCSVHRALMEGATVDQVTAARGADAATVAAEWREWAAGQRWLYADMQARGERPIGITAEEYAHVAGILGLDTADPPVTAKLPKQITGEQTDAAGTKRTVTLDVTDDDAYFALTEALGEWAHRQRCQAEDELANDPDDMTARQRLDWAEAADVMLGRVEALLY